jgi:hypothetical protein
MRGPTAVPATKSQPPRSRGRDQSGVRARNLHASARRQSFQLALGVTRHWRFRYVAEDVIVRGELPGVLTTYTTKFRGRIPTRVFLFFVFLCFCVDLFLVFFPPSSVRIVKEVEQGDLTYIKSRRMPQLVLLKYAMKGRALSWFRMGLGASRGRFQLENWMRWRPRARRSSGLSFARGPSEVSGFRRVIGFHARA